MGTILIQTTTLLKDYDVMVSGPGRHTVPGMSFLCGMDLKSYQKLFVTHTSIMALLYH